MKIKTTVSLAILIGLATSATFAQPDCSTQLIGTSMAAELFTVDITTGNGTLIGVMPGPLATAVEYDTLTDTLWAEEVNGNPNLHTIDPITAGSLGTVMHLPGGLTGLQFVGPDLYGTFIAGGGGGTPSDLVIVDTTTGAFNTLGLTGFGPISGLAYNGTTLYGVTAGGGPADLVTINLTTGAGTLVGATGYDFIGGLEFGPDGLLYAGTTANASTDPSSLLVVDTTTGAATPVGPTGFQITGLAACGTQGVPVIEIPTLSGISLGLLALLICALSLFLIRRRRTA